jgi:molecular chaperone GrpE
MSKWNPREPRPAGGTDGSASDEAARADDLPVDIGPAPEATESATAPVPAEPDYKDRWLRAEAELQNFRRRAQRDLEESTRAAEDRLLVDLVELLDDLERAGAAARDAGAPEAWVKGIDLLAGRMGDVLARAGVTPIEAVGKPFDPRLHEAMLEVDTPEGASPGDVVGVFRGGYRRGERTLRAARVSVARIGDE